MGLLEIGQHTFLNHLCCFPNILDYYVFIFIFFYVLFNLFFSVLVNPYSSVVCYLAPCIVICDFFFVVNFKHHTLRSEYKHGMISIFFVPGDLICDPVPDLF